MRGMITIEGQNKFELATIVEQINDEELEKIKELYGVKYAVKLEPLFNHIKKGL